MNGTSSQETRSENLLTRLEVGVFRVDRNGRLVHANAAFLRMFGLPSPDAMESWRLESIAACPIQAGLILEEMRHRGRARFPDLEVRSPGGGTMWIRVNQIAGSFPGEEDTVEGIVEDVTDHICRDSEQRNLEEVRNQAQKLESIGRLAGGVAHDFNNLLTAINGYSELLLGMLPEDNPLRENLVEIKKAGTRAAHLTRELLAFSRRQLLVPKVLDLNDLILSLDRLIRRAAGDGIELEVDLDARLGKIECDPGQMENVIMNLVFNARDAMIGGGTLRLRTANAEVGSPAAPDRRPVRGGDGHGELASGSYVSLTVSDTGSGMDRETLSRVFEPFFTTRPLNKAAGMGLAMVYGIIKQSGGHIFAESEAGKGTFFRIYFPRVEEGVEGSLASPTAPG
ncbi:MAG TPA: ATP-binding protein [Fibrobacteria bacterium]|nr:ATP-binding protein [Fibrobacteria bacterium]